MSRSCRQRRRAPLSIGRLYPVEYGGPVSQIREWTVLPHAEQFEQATFMSTRNLGPGKRAGGLSNSAPREHGEAFREESIATYILDKLQDHILGHSVLQTHISWLVDCGNVKIFALGYDLVIKSE